MLKVKRFFQPLELNEALALLQEDGAKPLAGGTDLVPSLRRGDSPPLSLVDLSRLDCLKRIEFTGRRFVIGSLVTFSRLASSPLLLEHLPVLTEAAASVGSPQIRNLGTIGGNIANASPAADLVTALVALDAEARLVSLKATRTIPLAELFDAGQTVIRPDELIAGVTFEMPLPGSRSGFAKLGRRRALAIARLNMAVILTWEGPVVLRARVALGAAAPHPCRIPALERVLAGRRVGLSLVHEFSSLAGAVVAGMLGDRPSVAYKREAVCGIAADLLTRLLSGEGRVQNNA